MTNEITTYSEPWIIKFMNNSFIEISAKTGEDLQRRSLQVNTPEFFTVNGVTHNFKSVVFLGPKSDFQQQFPDDLPIDYHQPYSFGPDVEEMSWEDIKTLPGKGIGGIISDAEKSTSRERMLKASLRGIDQFLKDHSGSKWATEHRQVLLAKLNH